MRTVVPVMYIAITAPYIQTSIFIWTYLRWYWRYLDNSLPVRLQSLSQIQRTSPSLRYVNCGPGHIQNIYSTAYSGFYIQLNVSALLLEMPRQFNVRYTANLVPNIARILQYKLCGLWYRTYTMNLQLHIFSLQYLTEPTCAAIGDMPISGWALYWKLEAKYSAHPPVYPMWSVAPSIYNVITTRIFRLYYSADRICAVIGDISTILCALYRKVGAKYSTHR
jgi:hypothetical protein